MIVNKITREEVDAQILQAEAIRDFSGIRVPLTERNGEYQSFKPQFDKLSGSRARCFSAAFWKHSFAELAKAESEARGVKLSKNDLTNLHERFAQVLQSFFGVHAKSPTRYEYKLQYLSLYRGK